MKKIAVISILAFASVLAIYAADTWVISNRIFRFSQGSYITFDGGAKIADEDGAWTLTPTKLSYLNGITSDVQTQINAKAGQTSGTFGTIVATNSVTDSALTLTNAVVWTSGATGLLTNKTVANSLLSLGIQSGSATTSADGTVTNAFGKAFTGVPIVTLGSGMTIACSVTNITTTNCVIAGATNAVINWIAIGAP